MNTGDKLGPYEIVSRLGAPYRENTFSISN